MLIKTATCFICRWHSWRPHIASRLWDRAIMSKVRLSMMITRIIHDPFKLQVVRVDQCWDFVFWFLFLFLLEIWEVDIMIVAYQNILYHIINDFFLFHSFMKYLVQSPSCFSFKHSVHYVHVIPIFASCCLYLLICFFLLFSFQFTSKRHMSLFSCTCLS
jgi:hypothetical protein